MKYLKVFNETIGFEKTNEMLREIGRVYLKETEKFNKEGVKVMVCRYGGDEFLIIIGEKTKEEAKKILKEIQKELRKIRKPEAAPFGPKFSRGAASLEELPPEEREFSKLIELADKRVIKEKKESLARLKERAKRPGQKLTRKLVKKIKRYQI